MKTCTLMLAVIFSSSLYALQLDGFSEFSQRYELKASITGTVDRVNVRPGQSVKRGAVLLTLEQSRFKSAVQRANALVNARQPEQRQLQTELEKAEELFDRDSLAMVELQTAENNLQIAESQLESAKAELQIAEFDLQQTNLKAPIDGMVLAVNSHRQDYVNAEFNNRALVTLVDHQNMIAVALLTDQQWDLSLLGKAANITFQDKQFSGKVISLDHESVNGSTQNPTFKLKVLFVASGEIPANMPLTINIQE